MVLCIHKDATNHRKRTNKSIQKKSTCSQLLKLMSDELKKIVDNYINEIKQKASRKEMYIIWSVIDY